MKPIKETPKPIRDRILVSDMEFGEERTRAGIVILSDNGKTVGIHPRWGKVWAVGPKQHDVKVGEWVCVEHGRWTRAIEHENEKGEKVVLRMIDNEAILAVNDYRPSDVDRRNA